MENKSTPPARKGKGISKKLKKIIAFFTCVVLIFVSVFIYCVNNYAYGYKYYQTFENNSIMIGQTLVEDFLQTNIQHKCLVCNHEWSARPHNILSGFGCPQCALNNRTIVGVNDMWTTAPELAKCLENPEDGYKYPKSSKERVNFICPDCGSLLKDRVIHHTYFNGGLKCPYCSDGMSVPNKFMSQILQYCNVDYEPEYIFDWAKDKRYDFYLPNHNAILEIMGGQHYQENNFASKQGRTLEEEQDNDVIKLDLAKNNGVIYYYQIDFRYSDFEYMRNKLIDSELFSLLKIDINTIDFESCYKASLKSRVFEAVDYWNKGLKVNDI